MFVGCVDDGVFAAVVNRRALAAGMMRAEARAVTLPNVRSIREPIERFALGK
jgi:hypothetical protein